MKWQIRRCPKCREYTLKDICPKCNIATKSPIPPKFSPQDKYARYRMQRLDLNEDNDDRSEDQTE